MGRGIRWTGRDLLIVFSSNADPFVERTGYSKFYAYTLLEHGGDFHAASRALARRGYGKARKRRVQKSDPFARYAGYAVRSRHRPG